ncbi:MAG TPA: methyltransferase domain-containing protein [Vicinamibacterales bacterium]|nr:methyltransferase domain-containing protein [Vicinamibacterales bacterium]
MMTCGCCLGDSVERQFGPEKVAQELQLYRRKGAGSTTRLLRDGLATAGLTSGELLDVGAGFGALTFELLDRGMSRATVVEMSSAYLAAAIEEAARRGRSSSVHTVHGDFVAVAPGLPASTVVTLDRVVCCYPSPEPLLEQALGHAKHGFAFSYPRDRWYVRVGVWLENALRRWRGNSFRTFVHPAGRMHQLIEREGFTLASRRCSLAWCADVFMKRV